MSLKSIWRRLNLDTNTEDKDVIPREALEEVYDPGELKLKPKQAKFLKAFIKNDFHISNSCKEVQMSLMTYNNWKNQDPMFARALEICRETEVDLIEDAFRDLIRERNPQAVLFGLKTRGKKRGYEEKPVVDVGGISSISISFEKGENGKNIEHKTSD